MIKNIITIDTFIDKKLSIDDVNWDIYKNIEKLAPYGEGNPKPVFIFENVAVKEVKQFGKTNNHLELSFENQKGKKIRAIGFFMSSESFKKSMKSGEKIDLIASFEKSNFRNYPELRLRIMDIL